jgi:hypothetical protein
MRVRCEAVLSNRNAECWGLQLWGVGLNQRFEDKLINTQVMKQRVKTNRAYYSQAQVRAGSKVLLAEKQKNILVVQTGGDAEKYLIEHQAIATATGMLISAQAKSLQIVHDNVCPSFARVDAFNPLDSTGIFTQSGSNKYYLKLCSDGQVVVGGSLGGYCEQWYYEALADGSYALYTTTGGVKYYLRVCEDGSATSATSMDSWCSKFYLQALYDGTYGIYTTNGANKRYYLKVSSAVNGPASSVTAINGWSEKFYVSSQATTAAPSCGGVAAMNTTQLVGYQHKVLLKAINRSHLVYNLDEKGLNAKHINVEAQRNIMSAKRRLLHDSGYDKDKDARRLLKQSGYTAGNDPQKDHGRLLLQQFGWDPDKMDATSHPILDLDANENAARMISPKGLHEL